MAQEWPLRGALSCRHFWNCAYKVAHESPFPQAKAPSAPPLWACAPTSPQLPCPPLDMLQPLNAFLLQRGQNCTQHSSCGRSAAQHRPQDTALLLLPHSCSHSMPACPWPSCPPGHTLPHVHLLFCTTSGSFSPREQPTPKAKLHISLKIQHRQFQDVFPPISNTRQQSQDFSFSPSSGSNGIFKQTHLGRPHKTKYPDTHVASGFCPTNEATTMQFSSFATQGSSRTTAIHGQHNHLFADYQKTGTLRLHPAT